MMALRSRLILALMIAVDMIAWQEVGSTRLLCGMLS